jgi:hypothetical protein
MLSTTGSCRGRLTDADAIAGGPGDEALARLSPRICTAFVQRVRRPLLLPDVPP